jgi:hypothetical protein
MEYPTFVVPSDPVLAEITTFCNQVLLEEAADILHFIAKDSWPRRNTDIQAEFSRISTRCTINSRLIASEASACTFSNTEIWLNENYVKRAQELDQQNSLEDHQNESKLIKIFLAYCLAHEMAHVLVRWKLGPEKQQIVNTSPQKLGSKIPDYSYRAESGWFLEDMVFNGISGLG